jgi:hypothetical protein
MFFLHYIGIDSPFHYTGVYKLWRVSFVILSRKIKIKIYAIIIVPFAAYRREKHELSRFGKVNKPNVFFKRTLRKT